MSLLTSEKQAHNGLQGQICSLIAKATALPLDRISVASKLDGSVGIDSMTMIEISVAIEENLGVIMPDLDSPEAAHIKTVGDLVGLVAQKLSNAAGRVQP